MMEYKGYTGKIEFDDEADIFHGEVLGIRDVVTFQGKSVNELKKAFHQSINDYLEFCQERGEEPDKPFTGKFVIRLTPEQHRKVYLASKIKGQSLNSWVSEVLQEAASIL
ncbi:MAG: type II toxin-antitoxin system HicB family antitoxin [Deltaproteobacteria bacterium]|nr:type II toxin-antitoxin system HicB family antitoxin [Deltaproteobacteria bacterium]